jgi:hypothetical protein
MDMRLLPVAVALSLVSACSESPSGGDDQPDNAIARLRGTLDGETQIDIEGLRVAIVWIGDGHDSTKRPWVPQEVEVVSITPTWPAQFELAITDPPPAGAMHFQIGYSQARLVAYRDLNGNGQLDWTPVTADAFVDRVVAYNPGLVLWYFDDGGLKLMLPGSGDLLDPTTPITMLERSALRASCHLLDWMPRSAFEAGKHSYPDPDEGDQGPWDHEGAVECPGGQPPADVTHLACDETPGPGDYQFWASWTTQTSEFVSSVCGPVMRICWTNRPDPSVGGPWPCPCDAQTQATCGRWQSDL